tara:strand:- start:462 stop:1064 length:603 start_codon:yes stop_codon:yes gene_type:complete
MRKKINIYSDKKIQTFLNELCPEYELSFYDLESIKSELKKDETNIIFLNQKSEPQVNYIKNLDHDLLIFTNLKNPYININKNSKLFTTPISISNIKNSIKKFVENLKINFYDLSINNEKLINKNNNVFCYLTHIEKEIFLLLIKEKEITKNSIKQNILNIKPNVETNSLDSHLTRIRKKIKKINSRVKIYSKKERLLISY